jgi:hypothetical protein
MAMGLASALGGFKNAKDAKNAKNANPRELAFLGRAGDPIVAEAGGTTTGCGMELKPPALRGDAVAKTAKNANPRELAYLPSRLGRAVPGAHLGCRNASERAKLAETSRN